MSRVKLIVSMFVAVAALGALASSASAVTVGCMVGGTLLQGLELLATTAKVDKNAKLTTGSVVIECTGETLNGVTPMLTAPNSGSAGSLEFTKCKPTEGKCTIESEKIGTVPILAEATLEGALAVVAVFKPETGKVFTNLTFLGATCSLEGTQPVQGTQAVLAPFGQDENTLQLINAITLKEGELKVGAGTATLTGSALLKLETGKPWSFL